MSKERKLRILEEAIDLENNASRLYMVFHKAFAEDEEFWWKLAQEEKNHASLLRSGAEYYLPLGKFPDELLPDDFEQLSQANKMIIGIIERCITSVPSREEAFDLALRVENAAGELHFQKSMEMKTDSKILEVFQKLNEDDKDHARRITAYMQKNNIRIDPDITG